MVFDSAVDWWYYAIILAVAGVTVWTVYQALCSPARVRSTIAVVVLGMATALSIWLLFSTDYRIGQQILTIRSGPFSWVVPLNDVVAVRRTRSSRSSPALSLNRIEISYGKGQRVMVSPKDADAFLRAIDRN